MTINKRCWKPLVLVAVLLITGCGQESGDSTSKNSQQAPPKPAKVMKMARRDIKLDKSYPAKLRSSREAVVIARVRGLLEQRHFTPGQRVNKGDSLYAIEPTVYQAAVGQREADLKSAQAQAYQARRDAERAKRLMKTHAISTQKGEQTIAQRRVAAAKVAQAKAALDSAKVDIGYTKVTAPVSGQISLSEVNVGNVVSPGTELATITPLNPLEVRFQLPQEDGFDLRRQRQRQHTRITAVLEFPGLKGTDAATLKGKLDFLGSSVSQNTSTVQAQAIFDNPNNMYLPGQFVRVRLEGMKRYHVLAVPEIAVTQGLLGPQVFTLNKDNVTTATDVKPGEEAGSRIIISNGLKPGDRVIVSDPGAIKAGMKIKPQPYDGGDQSNGQAGGDQKSAHSAASGAQRRQVGSGE